MARSNAATVEEYLSELPEDRRAVVAAVRKVVLKHLPKGIDECMRWGMISYEVPLEESPKTCNGQPLSFAGLAAQKNHYALYLMCAGCPKADGILREGFKKAGKKLDKGKSCLRFRKLDDLPLEVIGKAIASISKKEWIAVFEATGDRNSTDANKHNP